MQCECDQCALNARCPDSVSFQTSLNAVRFLMQCEHALREVIEKKPLRGSSLISVCMYVCVIMYICHAHKFHLILYILTYNTL